jgi:tetratricopeptide (TPR) repeat protein
LHETFVKEYTHAENGYLQVATETGVVGVALLVLAISMCGWWMLGCLRHARQHEHVFLFGAAAAGLVASAAHSVVDFVWYIPACMSVTIVLAACVLRLSQLVRSSDGQARGGRTLHRGRWLELAVASILIGAWSIHTYFGPAIAAVHWDQYRRAAVADTRISQQAFAEFSSGKAFAPSGDRQALSQAMLRRLQAAVYWDPHFARAHKQLADRYLAEFALRVSEAANVLDVRQIRDVAIASSFPSEGALQEWLDRAFGPDVELLRQAHVHARRAVELCPLQGGAYMHLADLAFLELGTHSTVEAYVDQALRLRPYDRNVLADAGVQALVLGEPARAIDVWSRCFNTPGSHQQRIVYRLVASGMPASEFLARLRPDWQTLRSIWAQYRTTGRPQDLSDILLYAENETRRAAAESNRNKLAAVLFWQSNLYSEVGRREESLACLERANGCNPRSFAIRYGLAKALMDAGRFAEAEPHVRWCLARRPADKALNAALPIISKYRLAQRAPVSSMQNSQSAGVPAEKSARSTAAATN